MSIPNIAALEQELRAIAARPSIYDDLEEDESVYERFEDGPMDAFDSGERAGEIQLARQLLSTYFTGE